MTRPSRSQLLGVLVSVAMVASLAAVGTADLWIPGTGDQDPDLPSYSVAPSSMTLACAPGTEDPYDAGATVAAGAGWSSRGSVTTGATPSLTVSTRGASTAVPSGVMVVGQGGGELRGLSLLPCTAPTSDQWIASGSTVVGEDLLLLLSNPSTVASQVSITSYGASGKSPDAPQSVNVPAGQVVVLAPATWFPDEERPAFHVVADGPGVSAWVQTSGLDGEVPTGVGAAPATTAGTDLVLPGVSAGSGASVRLVAPGDKAATVFLGVSDDSGVTPLAGAEDLEVDPDVPLDVDLSGVAADPVSLVVSSDVPVVATADVRGTGPRWPDSDQQWGSRTLVVPSTVTTGVDLPGAGDLSGLVEEQLGADVLRATSVGTPSGGGDVKAQLVLSAPADQGATVRIGGAGGDPAQSGGGAQSGGSGGPGGTSVEVPAGGSVTVDLPGAAGALSADHPVHVALVVTAGTPTGDQVAVWPLGTTGIDSLDVAVDVGP